MLQGYVEGDATARAADLVADGFDLAVVDCGWSGWWTMGPKYKLAPDAAVCASATAKAFGKDRRMPITNRYRSAPGSEVVDD